MKVFEAMVVASLFLLGCGDGAVAPTRELKDPKPPPSEPETGPIHIVLSGVGEAYIPTGPYPSQASTMYNIDDWEEGGITHYVWLQVHTVNIEEPNISVGMGWNPKSGTEELDLADLGGAHFRRNGSAPYDFDQLHLSISPKGVRIEGKVTTSGPQRDLLIEGPIHRECIRLATPEDDDLAQFGVDSVSDPDFTGPCTPFRE